jgi:alanyl-tRNA synthetase
VAGEAAYKYALAAFDAVEIAAQKLGGSRDALAARIDAVLAEKADADKRLRSFEQKASANQAAELAASAREESGLRFVCAVASAESPEALRALGSQVLGQIGEGVVRLGAIFGDKATVVAFSSPAAVKAGYQAGKIVAEVSVQLGGKGGGKPDFAMGGGRETGKLAAAIAAALARPLPKA